SRYWDSRLLVSLTAVPLFVVKFLHIYVHRGTIRPLIAIIYLPSFFLQDTFCILCVHFAIRPACAPSGFILAATVAVLTVLLATVTIMVFFVSQTEPQWRNAMLFVRPSSWMMLETRVVQAVTILVGLMVLGTMLRTWCSDTASVALDVLYRSGQSLFRHARRTRARIDQDDPSTGDSIPEKGKVDNEFKSWESRERRHLLSLSTSRIFTVTYLLLQVAGTILRPQDTSLTYLSQTLLLQPITQLLESADLLVSNSALSRLRGFGANHTSLKIPVPFSWLSAEVQPGFEDWYDGTSHYCAKEDPLRIPNSEDGSLPDLLHAELRRNSVRHVLMMTLESTRKDVFPLKKNGIIWKRIASSFHRNIVPDETVDRLAFLTPVAQELSGDYSNGFDAGRSRPSRRWKLRGGVNANDAFTTSTYTLKSLTSSHCGISPIAADYNIESRYHMYQPCLPQILQMFNNLACGGEGGMSPSKGPWVSQYMQSVMLSFDYQDMLMPTLGFRNENIIGSEQLRAGNARFKPVSLDNTNYFGMPETAIEERFRDAFATAKMEGTRLFLSHLTSTTHEPFRTPKREMDPAPVGQDGPLSRYLNAIEYGDAWIGRIMDLLEQEGVLNETLVVLVGDHGLAVAEDGSTSAYQNPHLATHRVPLIFSHPGLSEMIPINKPVTTLQILPTILDILRESNSLTPCEAMAAKDLVANYEGQSLIRGLGTSSSKTDQGSWHFTVINPGASFISVRDTRKPDWRLVIPLARMEEWRFSDLSKDPFELEPIRSFDKKQLMRRVEAAPGRLAVEWIDEAIHVSRWWILDNHRRWRY
ncbi:hypothetical protein DOTSEDRAFT_110771, partial [Dothistroma septosporum NZE10]